MNKLYELCALLHEKNLLIDERNSARHAYRRFKNINYWAKTGLPTYIASDPKTYRKLIALFNSRNTKVFKIKSKKAELRLETARLKRWEFTNNLGTKIRALKKELKVEIYINSHSHHYENIISINRESSREFLVYGRENIQRLADFQIFEDAILNLEVP